MIFQLLFLAIALSIDSLSIGISYGVRKICLQPFSIVIISLISLFFSSISLYLGSIITNLISESSTTYISVAMLLLMGIYIIFNSIKDKEKVKKHKKRKNILTSFLVRYLNISLDTIKNPEVCDLNKSLKIEPLEALYLGTALSIDSISIGFTVYSLNSYAILFPIFIMIFQLIFLSFGIFLGKTLNYKNSNKKVCSVVSGFILISISIIRLITTP